MTAQLQLLPSSPPVKVVEQVVLDRIDGFADAIPSRELREQLRAFGQLQPIVAVPAGERRFRIVDGRRRAKAVAQLAEEGEWPAPPAVDLLILGGGEAAQRSVRSGLTLALHASRSPSPASELQAIETILGAAKDQEEASTVKQIAAQTGLSVQTVRRRLRLRSLTRGLREAFDEGRVSASVAEAAARLTPDQQGGLEHRLYEDGRLTLADIRDATRAQTSAATAALPHELFADHESAWQATLRGHLKAALGAIPPGEPDAPVVRAITDALTRAEQL